MLACSLGRSLTQRHGRGGWSKEPSAAAGIHRVCGAIQAPYAGETLVLSRSVAMYSSGMYWFTGKDSIYWGHNVLIRIAPFMANCNLPIMPGKPPLGGPIMSQDFVEAALLGRGGWGVEWDLVQGGSFDELPANIITYGERDRRWCQGNIRNFWLMFGDGMKLAHRLFLSIAMMAYLASPMFLLWTVLGFIQAVRHRTYQMESAMFWWFIAYFSVILLLPKILGLFRVTTWDRPKKLKKEVLSMFLETGLIVVTAPALFYLHSLFVIRILLGKTVNWTSQPRDPAGQLTWREAGRAFWAPTVLGALWLALAAKLDLFSLAYLSPTLGGWLFSIPFAVLTSNIALGKFLARHGLFDDCLTAHEVRELGPFLSRFPGSAAPLPSGLEPPISEPRPGPRVCESKT